MILDEIGGSIGCSALMAKTCELLVGRYEGVFSYSVSNRFVLRNNNNVKRLSVSFYTT